MSQIEQLFKELHNVNVPYTCPHGRPLKIDGEDVRQFFDHYTALRFVQEGSEILSAPKEIQYSREQLIKIFKHAADLLRKSGLQAGTERFGAFSDILFLKLMDEKCELEKHAGKKPSLPDRPMASPLEARGS